MHCVVVIINFHHHIPKYDHHKHLIHGYMHRLASGDGGKTLIPSHTRNDTINSCCGIARPRLGFGNGRRMTFLSNMTLSQAVTYLHQQLSVGLYNGKMILSRLALDCSDSSHFIKK